MSSHSALILSEVSWNYLEQYHLWSGHEYLVEMSMFNVQKVIKKKLKESALQGLTLKVSLERKQKDISHILNALPLE